MERERIPRNVELFRVMPECEELAAKLLRLRKLAHLTGEQAAVRARMSQSKLSKIENCRLLPSERDVELLLTVYDAKRAVRRSLAALMKRIHSARLGSVALPTQETMNETVETLELDSSVIFALSRDTWYGALQTSEYASAMLDVTRGLRGRRDVILRTREKRRRALLARSVEFVVVVPERLLNDPKVSGAVMDAQLDELDRWSRTGRIELGIIPDEVAYPLVHDEVVLFDEEVVLRESTWAPGMTFSNCDDVLAPFQEVCASSVDYAIWESDAHKMLRDARRRLGAIDVRETRFSEASSAGFAES